MKPKFTNLGKDDVAVGVTRTGGWVVTLLPYVPALTSIASEFVTMSTGLSTADKIRRVLTLLLQVVTLFSGRKPDPREPRHAARLVGESTISPPPSTDLVRMRIANDGTEDLEVVLGEAHATDVLKAGTVKDFVAPEWIEVRPTQPADL